MPPSSRHMTSQREEAPAAVPHYPLEVHALRLLELTQRTSSVMAVTEASSHGFDSEFRVVATRDPVLDAFRAFAALHDVAASGQVAVVPTHGYAEALALRAAKWHFMDAAPAGESADLVLVPWTESGGLGSDGGMLGGIGGSGIPTLVPSTSVSRSRGGSGGGDGDHPLSQQPRFAGRQHLAFVQAVLRRVGDICTVGILISDSLGGLATRSDPEVHTGGGKAPAAEGEKPAGLTRTRSSASGRLTASRRQRTSQQQPIQQQFFPPILDRSQVVLVPFVGGADDRVALRLGLQLARSQRVVLHVVRLKFDRDGGAEADESESESGDDDDEGAHDVQNEKSADADDKAGASKATDTAAATLSTESPVPKDKDQKIMKKENEGEEEENGGEEEEGKNKEEENEEREKKEKKGEDEEGKKKKKEGDEEKKKKPIYRRIAALRYTGRGGRRRRRRLSVSSKSGTHLDDAPSTMDLALLSSVRRSLPPGLGDRVHFHEVFVAMPPTPNGGRTGSGASGTAVGALADAAVAAARVYVRRKAGNAGDIIVVGRRRDGGAGAGKPGDDCRRGPGPSASASASAAAVDGTGEAGESSASAGGSDSAAASSAKGDAGGHSIRNDFQATVGVLAERLVAARLGASVLVVQAARRAFMNA